MNTVANPRSSASAASTLASIVESILSCNESLKCVVDVDQSILVNCPAILLQNLDIQHPASYIINEAVQNQHKIHGSCCKTLLVLIGYWARALEQSCSKEGLPMHAVIQNFNQGIELCIKRLQVHAIHLIDSDQRLIDDSQLSVLTNSTCTCMMFDKEIDELEQSTSSPDNDSNRDECEEIQFSFLKPSSHVDTKSGSLGKIDVCTPTSPSNFPPEKNAGDEDDGIGWFFPGGEDPGPPQLDRDAAAILVELTNPGNSVITGSYYRDLLGPDFAATLQSAHPPTKTFQSICGRSNDEDQDFDSCFDDVNTQLPPVVQKSGVRNPIPKQCNQDCDTDNEFDSCFDDTPLSSKGVELPSPGIKNVQKMDVDNHDEVHQTITVGNQSEEKSPFLETIALGFEIKLQELLKRKTFDSSAHKVLNKSRHFKTIESNVQELAGECPQERTLERIILSDEEKTNAKSNDLTDHSTCAVPKEVSKAFPSVMTCQVNQRKSKTKISLNKMLDRSRHFRLMNSEFEGPMSSGDVSSNAKKESPSECVIPEKGRTTDYLNTDPKNNPPLKIYQDDFYSNYAIGLAHGSMEMMSLAIQAARKQREMTPQSPLFSLSQVNSISVCSSHINDTRLLQGWVVPVDASCTACLQQIAQPFSALVVNGSLCPSYKHLGFKKHQKTSTVYNYYATGSVAHKTWLERVTEVISQVRANALLIKGDCDPMLKNHCLANNIVVMEYLSYKMLQAVAESKQKNMLAYVEDALETDVVTGFTIESIDSDFISWDFDKRLRTLFAVKTMSSTFQTVILGHPVHQVSMKMEEEFWHCCHRLSNTLREKRIILGNGTPEKVAVMELQSDIGSASHDAVQAVAYRAIEEGFIKYNKVAIKNSSTLMSGDGSEPILVLDDLSAKCAAWKTAGHVVSQLMLCDMELINIAVDATEDDANVGKTKCRVKIDL